MLIRLFDIFFSGLALLVLSPLLIPIVIILRVTGEGEIFYTQQRVGQGGRKFGLIKFATMLKDSPNMKNAYITMRDDPRVLPVGRFLRKTKINELPQIINILKGDMSIVGPRPQVEAHLDLYPAESRDEIVALKPGLTGIASIFFRDEEEMVSNSDLEPKEFYRVFIAPYKAQLEIWYKAHQSLYVYFMLIFLTAWAIVFAKSKLYRKVFKDLPEPPKELVV